jgi:hypothetical protein
MLTVPMLGTANSGIESSAPMMSAMLLLRYDEAVVQISKIKHTSRNASRPAA